MTFTTLGITAELAANLAARNIHEPSEIQRLVIPALLRTSDEGSAAAKGHEAAVEDSMTDESSAAAKGPASSSSHLLFSSPTGTGKTLAYALPLLRKLSRQAGTEAFGAGLPSGESPAGSRQGFRQPGPELLVLAPTYELASQIKKEFDALLPAAFGGILSGNAPAGDTIPPVPRAALVIGSAPLNRQIDSLKKLRPIVVVGNPARVLQLVRMKKLSLKALRYLVLDEGDRLMADELFPETAELCRAAFPQGTPPGPERPKVPGPEPSAGGNPALLAERRTVACSATFSAKNRERLFSLTPAARWEIITQKENDILRKNIEHWAFFAEEREKLSLLCSFIAAVKPARTLVFTSRAGQVGRIVSRLQYRHLAAAGLWGDMDKKDRKAAVDGFRNGNIPILVSSDLAARGLDIDRISHIVALDVPESEETYIHRAGRTARAGKRGVMASFGGEEELRRLAKIEKKLGIAVYPKELYGGRLCAPETL
ncbi:MAG: DEAD/DEAH box helicase [Treponema sp.]|jgi:superfamily II DNA/RNA helicase|nr:DEAD/DEAH box helicase [Treponema sp.]